MEIARQILISFKEHKRAWRELIKKPSRDPKWYPPPIDWVKLNFDTTNREGYSFVAVVSRDHKGYLNEAWTKQISLGSSIRGEAEAAWCAIHKAAAKRFHGIIIKGDAWNVIEPLQNSGLSPHWSIIAIVKGILNLAKSFVNVNFSYVHRDGNVFAHRFEQ
ncbi:uncharacterized protein LOC142639676 [Castanea sativa]|uniref:uncharacterized protein LOC142639676 n=1 Tax=Castanea sativa TaxID=21020 RepID=UPI003F653FC7